MLFEVIFAAVKNAA
jgi:hypothetical protein